MKVVSTEALTKLIQLVKSAFIKVDDVVEVTEIETETPSEVELATVATSGSYNDLSNKPTIPSAVTEATVSGWGFTKNTGTVTSVNNVSPVNGNVTLSIPAAQVNADWNATSGVAQILNKPTIPTVNNPTITFTQGGTTKGTITLNQASNQTIALDAGARNIGQIIQSTIPLTDAGLHLLDGSIIQGNGIYSEFVDFMVQNSKKFNPAPFNFSGTASVNSNGITSYLDYNNRCTVSVNNVTPTNKIIYNFSGILKSNSIRYADMWGGVGISRSGLFNPVLSISYRNNTLLSITEDELSTYNDNFTDIKLELTATKIKVTIKNNSNTFTKEADVSISFGTITGIGFPGGDSGSFVANLKNCSLIVDDIEIFSGSTQQDYFTDETSWQNSVNTYGVCGKFVYDSINNTIRLPKISGFIEGTTDLNALDDLVQAGLPNITGSITSSRKLGGINNGDVTNNGALSSVTGNDGYGGYTNGSKGHISQISFNASSSNSIYGNSDTVQPQSVKVLYYICIATSTKTDIQVDIDEIATDLNGKADTDLSNINPAGKSFASGLAMPSSRYIDLTLGASGASYTAPANGWIFLRFNTGSGTSFITIVNNDLIADQSICEQAHVAINKLFIVPKGEYKLYYNNITPVIFRFVYAGGEA